MYEKQNNQAIKIFRCLSGGRDFGDVQCYCWTLEARPDRPDYLVVSK
jgi:hypothetical protein